MSSNNNKILIIDDDQSIRIALKFILKKNGYVVIEAVDGNEGLKQIKKFNPDIIITDLLMPNKSGIELIKAVRLDLKMKIPIVVLSSVGMEKVVMVAFELGANDFIQKPIKAKEIIDRIDKINNNRWIKTEK